MYEDYPVYIDVPVYKETDYDPVTGTILSFEIKEYGSRNFLRSNNAKNVMFEYVRIDSNQVSSNSKTRTLRFLLNAHWSIPLGWIRLLCNLRGPSTPTSSLKFMPSGNYCNNRSAYVMRKYKHNVYNE